MAKDKTQYDAEGNPVHNVNDFSHLKSVSDILNPKAAGEIVYKLEDVQNRKFVISDASIEAGTFGSYAKLVLYDPATQEEKTVTSGATLIMTQVSALINAQALPCLVVIRKMGKTWTLN
jgi:hypothetical protein